MVSLTPARAALPLLLATLGACWTPPTLVAPLRYGPIELAREEAFRAVPPRAAPAAPIVAPTFQITKLDNGLTVAVAEQHALPIVSMALVLARGSADAAAPYDTYELLGKLLDEPPPRRPGVSTWGALGGEDDVHLTQDGCALTARITSDRTDEAVGILASVALGPRLDPYAFSLVRAQWMFDFASSEHSGGSGLNRNLRRLVFGRAHPYGFTLLPSEHTAKLTAGEVVALHARLFHPAHATLVFTGDTTVAAAVAAATKWLGAWRSDAAPLPRPAIAAPEPPRTRITLIPAYELQQADALLTAAVTTDDEDELAAVEVLVGALGGTTSSLFSTVRHDQRAAYGFGGLFSRRRGGTIAGVGGSLDRDRAQPALKAILAAVAAARQRGIAADEVARAKESLLASYRSAISSTNGLLDLAIDAAERGASLDRVSEYPARIAAVTPAAVQKAAERWFDERSLRLLVIGDYRWLEDLDDLGLGEIERRNAWAERLQ